MSKFLFLNESAAILIDEINRVTLEPGGKEVRFYLKDGSDIPKTLEEPVTLSHVFKIISEAKRNYHPMVTYGYEEWDTLSERILEEEQEEKEKPEA